MPNEATISDLMNRAKLVCVAPDTTVTNASRAMLERGVGAVLVTDRADPGRILGIMTERDINYRLIAAGRDAMVTMVAEIMTRNPKGMPPETPVSVALKVMARSGYRHLPVVEDDKAIGIVSITDVFKESRRKLGHDMQMMERFIMGDLTDDERPETAH